MIKCNLCWCNTVSWKGLGCKLHHGAYSNKMPCGINENFMAIMAEKHRAHDRLRELIKEIRQGVDIDRHGIDALSKEIVASLEAAESKMLELCLAYQAAVTDCQKDYDEAHKEDQK